MRRSLSGGLLVVAATSSAILVSPLRRLPELASHASIGKQLAELKGSDTLPVTPSALGAIFRARPPSWEHRALRRTPAGVRVHQHAPGDRGRELEGSDTVASDFFGYSWPSRHDRHC